MAGLGGPRATLDNVTRTDRRQPTEVVHSLPNTRAQTPKRFFDEPVDRVTRIRTAIANGYYRVRSADIAQKLLDTMREGTGLRLRREAGDSTSLPAASVSSTREIEDATFRPPAASESEEEQSMSEWVKLTASDDHELSAYVAKPEGEPIGALVVIQEIFGVNEHIRSVADGYAKDGFLAIAPALFDRFEKGVELKYDGSDMQKAYELYGQLKPELALKDVAAAFHHVKDEGKAVGVIGYCYGGFMSWLSATRGETEKMQPACAVGYYAGGIGNVATEEPSCPVLLNFGSKDTHIGPEQIEAVRAAHGGHDDGDEVKIFIYEDAEHGFNCDMRGSYNPEAAKLARERSLAFLKANIA